MTSADNLMPCVILINGWSSNSSIWDDVLKPIANDLPLDTHVAYIDWSDGMLNPEEALRQTASAVNAKAQNPDEMPVIIVGWSLGGQIALQAADMAPDLVQSLILISTPVRLLIDETGVGTDPTALRAMRQGLRRDTDTILRNFWGEATAGDQTGYDIADNFDSIIADVDAKTLDKGLACLGDTDLRKRLPLIQTPTLILHGDDDRITGTHPPQQLSDGLPNSSAMVVNGASHALPLTHPHMVSDVLQAVLTTQTSNPSQKGETLA